MLLRLRAMRQKSHCRLHAVIGSSTSCQAPGEVPPTTVKQASILAATEVMVAMTVEAPAAVNGSEVASGLVTAMDLTSRDVVWAVERAQAVSSIFAHACPPANAVQESGQMGTPVQGQASRLPVLGGTRQSAFPNVENGSSYRASPVARQPLRGGVARNMGNFSPSGAGKASKIPGFGGQSGTLGR